MILARTPALENRVLQSISLDVVPPSQCLSSLTFNRDRERTVRTNELVLHLHLQHVVSELGEPRVRAGEGLAVHRPLLSQGLELVLRMTEPPMPNRSRSYVSRP